MARQNINIGTSANDNTGDTLRVAGGKINDNFKELYVLFGGDSSTIAAPISFSTTGIVFEGSSADSWETTLTVIDPTADRTIVLPNASGNIVLDSASQTLVNKTIKTATLSSISIKDFDSSHNYVLIAGNISANRNIRLPALTDSDTFVFLGATQTLTNKTITSPTISSPRITTGILDANGADLILFTATASAVNELTIANAATGAGPTISAVGADSNINLNLTSKGTGAVRVTSKVAYSSETLTSSGAVSLLVPLTIFNSGSALSMTLANGSVTGESKKFVNINTGAATVTPTTFGQGTSFTVNANGAIEAIWAGSKWFLLGYDSSTTNYITVT